MCYYKDEEKKLEEMENLISRGCKQSWTKGKFYSNVDEKWKPRLGSKSFRWRNRNWKIRKPMLN